MFFRLDFEVVYQNGDKAKFKSTPGADMAFEGEFGFTIASLFTSMPDPETENALEVARNWIGTISDRQLMFLAWKSSQVSVPFEEWADSLTEINWELPKMPVDPTRPARPATSSALSLPPQTSARTTSPNARSKPSSPSRRK